MIRHSKGAKNVAFQAVLSAIMLLSMFIPKLGFVSFAFLPLIAVCISALYLGFWNGVVTGLIFGLMSFIGNIAMPSTVFAPYFQNPLISVLPRLLIGIVAFGAAHGILKLFPNAKRFLSDGIGCFLAVLTNTGLVLGLMLWIYGGDGNVTPTVIGTIFLSNSIVEIVVTTIFTPLILSALRKSDKRKL